jgi:hypothetical protein
VYATIAVGYDRGERHSQPASAAIPLIDDLAALRGLQLERAGTGGRQPHRTALVGGYAQIGQSTAVLALLRGGRIRRQQPGHADQQRQRRQPVGAGQRVVRYRDLVTDDPIAHGVLRDLRCWMLEGEESRVDSSAGRIIIT